MNHNQLLCSFQKGKDLKLDMQPLHKIYGLITCLTCTIYCYKKNQFKFFLQLIFIFIQELMERKLQILNFTIYLYINSNDDLKPCKV
jgi:hypothetical protein